MAVRVSFIGSGDAFGSGGRFQTCFLVDDGERPFLVDCGASSLVAMRRFGIRPNDIELIVLSHLHGDHFGGIPFFLLDAQLISKRNQPLTIAGPQGTSRRVTQAMEALFPGSSRSERPFRLTITELEPEQPRDLGQVRVTAYMVDHPSGDPALALRMECRERIVAYSGDTEWTNSLVSAAKGADLFIAEAYFYEKRVKYHLDYRTLMHHIGDLQPKRLIVTHMSDDMLGRLDVLDCEYAED